MSTVAIMLTRDRRATVQVCLPAWAREKQDMELWCIDDGSVEYGPGELRAWGADEVFPLTPDLLYSAREVRGSARVAGLMTAALQQVVCRRPGVEWVYKCDSDTVPCAGLREIMVLLQRLPGWKALSLYRSSYQEARASQGVARYRTRQIVPTSIEVGGSALRLLTRDAAPGCSLLLRAAALRELGDGFGVTEERLRQNQGTWDHAMTALLGPVGVSSISLVEHLGLGGLHNPSWDLDRAHNPTADLQASRPGLIQAIVGESERERQNSYSPAEYWLGRLAEEGPCYVGAGGRVGARRQAQAFLGALVPELETLSRQSRRALLDFGCGTGRLADQLGGFAEYHGVDINPGAVEYCRANRAGRFESARLPLPFPDGSFDVSVAVTVLQHVPERDIEAVCSELRRVTRKGGRILLIEDANPEVAKPAAHMAFRSPQFYASALASKTLASRLISAERRRSHYLLVLERT